MPILPNLKQSAKDFIVNYALEHPIWKKQLVNTYRQSSATAVYMVRNDLIKESCGVILLAEILRELMSNEWKH